MTREQLITENEQLHTLLADAATALHDILSVGREDPTNVRAALMATRAHLCLERIR